MWNYLPVNTTNVTSLSNFNRAVSSRSGLALQTGPCLNILSLFDTTVNKNNTNIRKKRRRDRQTDIYSSRTH